ncbi:peptidase M48 family protein [Sphingomonas spermidinifaciens]|uniref:Peptidase M48 family protein n=2 Tax=Sphingomonas spermidinifaciens TaxID=1141889 RepID=A0A2A4AZS1_9SPHN|nr:peptidase M48 family protein [Sphingomonas spermidinifaciens]
MVRLRRLCKLVAAVALTLIGPPSVAAEDYRPVFETLRAADTRLQTLGERLAVAAAPWCRTVQPALGIAIHGPDQYLGDARAAAIAHFGFTSPIGVAGIVPGGAAARAGVRADDSIGSIGYRSTATLAPLPSDTKATAPLAAFDRFAATLPPSAPLRLVLERSGATLSATLAPVAMCRARFEQRDSDAVEASADGILVQISAGLMNELDDDGVAVLLAHELAHNVLEHRRRLDSAGVRRGLLSGIGRNAGLFKQTEVEADILSVHILAKAGYDPALAGRFWRTFGPKRAGGLRSATHPGWRDRAATMAAEAGRVAEAGRLDTLLAARERPADGDWQAILVRAR